jgi:hypothetical protein
MILKLQKSVINLYKAHICKYALFVQTLHLHVTKYWMVIVNQLNLLHSLICILMYIVPNVLCLDFMYVQDYLFGLTKVLFLYFQRIFVIYDCPFI